MYDERYNNHVINEIAVLSLRCTRTQSYERSLTKSLYIFPRLGTSHAPLYMTLKREYRTWIRRSSSAAGARRYQAPAYAARPLSIAVMQVRFISVCPNNISMLNPILDNRRWGSIRSILVYQTPLHTKARLEHLRVSIVNVLALQNTLRISTRTTTWCLVTPLQTIHMLSSFTTWFHLLP